LFDVSRFFTANEDTPQDVIHQIQQARSMIERGLVSVLKASEDESRSEAERTREIMARIVFSEGEYEGWYKDEYPVSRPVPVSLVRIIEAE
jgi:hypothetical protein